MYLDASAGVSNVTNPKILFFESSLCGLTTDTSTSLPKDLNAIVTCLFVV